MSTETDEAPVLTPGVALYSQTEVRAHYERERLEKEEEDRHLNRSWWRAVWHWVRR